MACNYILTCELSHTSSIFERRQIIFVEFAHDICVLVVLLEKFCQVIINGDQRNTRQQTTWKLQTAKKFTNNSTKWQYSLEQMKLLMPS